MKKHRALALAAALGVFTVFGCGGPDNRSNNHKGESGDFDFTPSNFDPGLLSTATVAETVLLNYGTTAFDSDSMTFSNYGGQAMPAGLAIVQASAPDAVVLAFRNLTIAAGSELQLTGSRAVIIAVFGDAVIQGTISADASGNQRGPGGSYAGAGTGSFGGGGAPGSGGGGGGGFGSVGGNGGTGGSGSVSGGTAGSTAGSVALVPLRGGSPGGAGGSAAASGAGGGAVQLSVSGVLRITGIVNARGGLGADGSPAAGGGGGGGSGGGILLEADEIEIPAGASIRATGGDGGSGFAGGDGGNGASMTIPAQAGAGGAGGGGGGGGGGGRIRLNAASSSTLGGSFDPPPG
jgi:hypothetical protein